MTTSEVSCGHCLLPQAVRREPRRSCGVRSPRVERLPCSHDSESPSDRFPPDPKSIHEVETMIKKQLETEKDLNVTQEVRGLAARPASARLLEAARQTPQEVFAAYETTPQGQPRPDIMRALFGRNELARKKADSILKRLFKAFINPFTVVLIVLAVISFITDYVIVEPEDRRSSPPFSSSASWFSSAARCGLCRKCARATRRNVCRRWSRPPLRSCVTARAGNAPFRSLLWAT